MPLHHYTTTFQLLTFNSSYPFRDIRHSQGKKELILSKEDPCRIPLGIVVDYIFSCLTLNELVVSSQVSKTWRISVNPPILWKSAIYREIAFSSMNWAKLDEEIVKDVDFTKEMLSLPENIVEELRRSYKAFPNGGIKATHILVRMPKGLTIRKLGEIAKKFFPETAHGYGYIWERIIRELGDKSIDEFGWLLMTSKMIDNSTNKTKAEQQKLVADLAIKSQVPYRIPRIGEVATCVFAEYFRCRKHLFSNQPRTSYTHCQESLGGYEIVVGDFGKNGLNVRSTIAKTNPVMGFAAIRTFYGECVVAKK